MTSVSLLELKQYPRFQLSTEFTKVVYLAVEDDPVSTVPVGHRLMSRGRNIENAETPVAQRYGIARVHVDTVIVGSTMRHGGAHRDHDLAIRQADSAGDAAHSRPSHG
jgi:hypothetical protein